jgi:creatinine amidohydrolase
MTIRIRKSATRNASGILEEMTIEDVRAFKPRVAVLPLGSTEPHGPHLPYGTDTIQVTGLCRRGVALANQRGARALLYPALPITNNANVRKFPFACRIGVRTLMSVIIDIVTQCKEDGVMKVVLVNGHGGNGGAVMATLRELSGMDRMPFVCLADQLAPQGFKSPIEYPSDHGGESETSRMLYLRPALVRTERLANNPVATLKVPQLLKASFVRPWHVYVPESAGGEARKSTAAKGQAVVEAHARGLADLLEALSKARFDTRFPYR